MAPATISRKAKSNGNRRSSCSISSPCQSYSVIDHTIEKSSVCGFLYKWTNYIKGYQKRWFVLDPEKGQLSYYRTRHAVGQYEPRGSIHLHSADIQTEDLTYFIVVGKSSTKESHSDISSHRSNMESANINDDASFTEKVSNVKTYYLRATSERERENWVSSLENARRMARDRSRQSIPMDTEDWSGEKIGGDLQSCLLDVQMRTEEVTTCQQLLERQSVSLLGSLDECTTSASSRSDVIPRQAKVIGERLALLSLTSKSMAKASERLAEAALQFKEASDRLLPSNSSSLGDNSDVEQGKSADWQHLYMQEHEKRLRVELMVEQLAKQHSQLETLVERETRDLVVQSRTSSVAGDMDDCGNSSSDEFVDAVDEIKCEFDVAAAPPTNSWSAKVERPSDGSSDEENDDDNDDVGRDGNNSGSDDDDVVTASDEDNMAGASSTIHVVQKMRNGNTDFQPVMAGSGRKISTLTLDNANNCVRLREPPRQSRRSRVPDKPQHNVSLWSIVKNSIGKDLTRIPVPVNFSEPLSMLQRLTEDFEYSWLLDKAAELQDDLAQLAYVAAFAVSSYSTTALRTGKPFNPLLGETYELDRTDDLGFRCISEQVSHHPPVAAQYCESVNDAWKCWQEFSMRTKFKGKYLEVEPTGIAHLQFTASDNRYTWRKVKTVVHNIIIGRLWIDQHGEMVITNHRTGDRAFLKFEPYSYFRGTPKQVTGTITSGSSDNKQVHWILNGTWDSHLNAAPVINPPASTSGSHQLEIGETTVLWQAEAIDDGAEKYYSLSRFACQLNDLATETDGDDRPLVAPTDSRLRPDQRLMEEGLFDEANSEKVRLEEAQRQRRRKREAQMAKSSAADAEVDHVPEWFRREADPHNAGRYIYKYQGQYWQAKEQQDFSRCPQIY